MGKLIYPGERRDADRIGIAGRQTPASGHGGNESENSKPKRKKRKKISDVEERWKAFRFVLKDIWTPRVLDHESPITYFIFHVLLMVISSRADRLEDPERIIYLSYLLHRAFYREYTRRIVPIYETRPVNAHRIRFSMRSKTHNGNRRECHVPGFPHRGKFRFLSPLEKKKMKGTLSIDSVSIFRFLESDVYYNFDRIRIRTECWNEREWE